MTTPNMSIDTQKTLRNIAGDGNPVAPRKRQFSLAQLLALMLAAGVLLAAGRLIAIFENASRLEWGLVIGAFIAVTILIETLRMPRLTLLWALAGSLFLIAAVVQMGLSPPRRAALQVNCSGRLKQIVVALHNYHDQYGRFPPAIVRDAAGRPMHSWRVLLLPYLEEQTLYERYRMDEPWDGPNNKKLHGIEAPPYVCESARAGQRAKNITDTGYVVVVGPRTAFPDDRCTSLSDITDDHDSTILVVEVAGSGIHWMEPRDLHVTQMARQINPPRGQGISSLHAGGANAVMADGSLQFLSDKIPPATLDKLLTIDGGEPLEWEW
jgi:prepilin-type processing-associated H-X9-DG protein